jgi:hypothetical protein
MRSGNDRDRKNESAYEVVDWRQYSLAQRVFGGVAMTGQESDPKQAHEVPLSTNKKLCLVVAQTSSLLNVIAHSRSWRLEFTLNVGVALGASW